MVIPGQPMQDFHSYASLKTLGQFALDLGSIITHVSTLVFFLKYAEKSDDENSEIFKWVLIATIIIQAVVAIGLAIFRSYDLNDPYKHNKARWLNWLFFFLIVIVAILEAGIGVFEKFGIDHPIRSNGTCTPPTE